MVEKEVPPLVSTCGHPSSGPSEKSEEGTRDFHTEAPLEGAATEKAHWRSEKHENEISKNNKIQSGFPTKPMVDLFWVGSGTSTLNESLAQRISR